MIKGLKKDRFSWETNRKWVGQGSCVQAQDDVHPDVQDLTKTL